MWKSFRDELIITAFVLVLTIIASFYLAGQALKEPEVDRDDTEGDVTGVETSIAPTIAPSPTSVPPTPVAAVTIIKEDLPVAVPYGHDAAYDLDSYEVTITNAHLLFDSHKPGSRQFVATMVIKNKSVKQGIDNDITAKIIKDGNVIVPSASMTASDSQRIFPGERLTFDVKLSLIEGTDIAEIALKPAGATPMTHAMAP